MHQPMISNKLEKLPDKIEQINKMSRETIKRSLEYLESIQRQCLQIRFGDTYEDDFYKLEHAKETNFDIEKYFASQSSMTEPEKNEMRKSYAKSKESIQLQTKFESIQSYGILKTLFDTIEATAKNISLETKNKPIIGTAFSKEYNAFAEKVPNTDEYLIVFESELFTLSNLLAKLIALCLPDFKIKKDGVSFSFEVNRIRNHIQTNEVLQNRFADLVYNAIYLGQPNKTQQYFLDEPFGKLQYELLFSLELFVVGHEYGHIYCGHLNDSNLMTQLHNGKSIQRISPDWKMEFEADRIGLTLLLSSLKSNSLFPFSFLGPELFFTFIDIAERANNLLANGMEKRSYGSDTHPPVIKRRDRIRYQLKKSLPIEHLESYEFVSVFLENVVELLWENFKRKQLTNRILLRGF